MCHLFIVGRFVCRLFLCLPSHCRGALWIGNGKVAGLNIHTHTHCMAHWRNKSHHRHQHRQIQAHHRTVAKRIGRQSTVCAEELFPISHINIFLLCAMNGPNANACMFLKEKKKEKWLAKRKFILICFRRMTTTATTMTTITTKKYGALEHKKRRMCCHSQGNDTTIFMYYAENLHSLRLGFKTFYKWESERERERAWDVRRRKRARWIARTVKSSMKSYGFKLQQTNQCKTIE